MNKYSCSVLVLLLFVLIESIANGQTDEQPNGIYWTLDFSRAVGIGSVDYEGTKVDYSTGSFSLGSAIGYGLNGKNSLGIGAWINAFSQLGNDNLVLPFFIEYNYAFREKRTAPVLTIRFGRSFKFSDFSEVENGFHFNVRLNYRSLPILKNKISLNPFIGILAQQIKDDTFFNQDPQGNLVMITDDVTFKAIQLGLTLFIIN